MRLNDKIIERFEINSNVPSGQILETINKNREKQDWTDIFVVDYIDYEEIKVRENKIEIIRKPKTISAFRPDGKITIDITDLPDNRTSLKCEIFPYNGRLPMRILFLTIVLSIWSLLLLTIFIAGRIYGVLLMAILPWGAFGLLYYLKFLYTKNGLIDYSKKVITEITKIKKASS